MALSLSQFCFFLSLSTTLALTSTFSNITTSRPTTTTSRPTTTSRTSSSKSTSCGEGNFFCREDGFCIPENWACDGINDCGDNTDEEHCFQGQVLPSREEFFKGSSSVAPGAVCDVEEFKCQDYNRTHAQCIQRHKLCDDKWDCTDGSDEGGFCNSCPRYGCSGECLENPILGPKCLCTKGHVLGSDGKACLDLNECLESHPCNHLCLNESPGFRCLCATGYALDTDSKTCTLREKGSLLHVAYNHEVVEVSTDKMVKGVEASSELRMTSSAHVVLGLDFDPSTDALIMATQTAGQTSSIHTFSEANEKEEVLIENVVGLGNVAVDWISGLIYFTASGSANDPASIGVCSSDGRYCTFLNLSTPFLHRPRGLVVHPRRGLLFWSDWDSSGPRIEMAGMDGSGRVHNLVASKLEWPNALALDYASEKLFWADAQYRLIESLDLRTLKRHIVVGHNVHHPYDLAVFDNKIYWSDWQVTGVMATVLSADGKAEGDPWLVHKGHEGELVYGIAVDHPAFHDQDLYDPCQLANCSHLCTLAPEVKAVCLCPLGYSEDPLDPAHCLSEEHLSADLGASEFEPYPQMGQGRFRDLCDKGEACHNGGACLPSWKHRVGCLCPSSYGGRFCELDLGARAMRHGLPNVDDDATWIIVLAFLALLLVGLGAATGYYSRKWTPRKVREEKLLPRIPSVSFFRGSRSTSVPNQTEERQQFVRMEDGHHHLDLDKVRPSRPDPPIITCLHKVESFSNPLYTGPEGGCAVPKRNTSSPLLVETDIYHHDGLLMKSSADDSGRLSPASTIINLANRSIAYALDAALGYLPTSAFCLPSSYSLVWEEWS